MAHTDAPVTAPFSLLEQGKIAAIKAHTDIFDRLSAMHFGTIVQDEAASRSDAVLRQVAADDGGRAGDTLRTLTAAVGAFDGRPAKGWWRRLGWLLGRTEGAAAGAAARTRERVGRVDHLAAALERERDGLLRDLVALDLLHARNAQAARRLEIYLQAGQDLIDDARAAAAGQPDGQAALDRFERRLADLRLSKLVVLQAMAQIRLIQSHNTKLIENLQSSVLNLIPIWKNHLMIALAGGRQRDAAPVRGEAIAAPTPDGDNAAVLRGLTGRLVTMIDATLALQARGRADRARAATQLRGAGGRSKPPAGEAGR